MNRLILRNYLIVLISIFQSSHSFLSINRFQARYGNSLPINIQPQSSSSFSSSKLQSLMKAEISMSSQTSKQSKNRFKNIIKNIFNKDRRLTLFPSKSASNKKPSKNLQPNQQLGKLILVRSAESRWKTSGIDGKFAGWTDVGLSVNGAKDIEYTGK